MKLMRICALLVSLIFLSIPLFANIPFRDASKAFSSREVRGRIDDISDMFSERADGVIEYKSSKEREEFLVESLNTVSPSLEVTKLEYDSIGVNGDYSPMLILHTKNSLVSYYVYFRFDETSKKFKISKASRADTIKSSGPTRKSGGGGAGSYTNVTDVFPLAK